MNLIHASVIHRELRTEPQKKKKKNKSTNFEKNYLFLE